LLEQVGFDQLEQNEAEGEGADHDIDLSGVKPAEALDANDYSDEHSGKQKQEVSNLPLAPVMR